jgi:predicted nucleotidyltransferase
MGGRETLVRQLRSFREDLAQRIHVDKMILFGSRTSEDPPESSDVDLVTVSDDFEGTRSRYRALGFRSLWNLDYAVDFLCVTEKEFEKLSRQVTIIREAVRTGIEIE